MRKLALLLLMLTSLLVQSCDTRRTIYPDGKVFVEISLNWENLSKATRQEQTAPRGATVAFYPQEGHATEPIFVLTNYAQTTAYIPVGVYNILVFNETVDGHDYIEFDGIDNYDTVTAYWESSQLAPSYVRSTTRAVVNTEDLLLVDRLEGFEITDQMLIDDEVQRITFTPVLVNRRMTVTAHIKGMDNVATSGSVLYVEGMAAGYNLSKGITVNESTTHLMTLNNKTFDPGSYKEGTMSATFYTFGDALKGSASYVFERASAATKAEDDNNSVRLSFALRNGTTHPDVERDITDEIDKSISTDVNLEIKVNVGTGVDDDDLITLPDVDDTNPDAGSGFDAEVDDWEDEIITDVPI